MEKVRCILRATALTDTLMTSASTPTSSAWSIAAWLRRWPTFVAGGEWAKAGMSKGGGGIRKKLLRNSLAPPQIFPPQDTGRRTTLVLLIEERAARWRTWC